MLASGMFQTASAESVLAAARRGGADFAEVDVERWRRRTLRTIDGDVEEAASASEQGVGLRLFFGTGVVYACTNDLGDAAVGELPRRSCASGGEGNPAGANALHGRRHRRRRRPVPDGPRRSRAVGRPRVVDRFPPAAIGERAAHQALGNLRARPAPAGTMPVVLGNGFGGDLPRGTRPPGRDGFGGEACFAAHG
ncbi:MAG: hypothetical protein K0A98_08180 [Trueperaceae bacterium]|nr:hypothetical protein [Trueperaceae bacterium]